MLKLVKTVSLIAQVGIAGSTKCGNNVILQDKPVVQGILQ